MGGVGLVVIVVVEVDVFSVEVRFRIWLSSEGNKQPRQVCLQQGVVLVQVRGVSC